MKHATQDALDELEGLLAQIRALGILKEKSPGVFYRRAKAFLHFHEDLLGLFADVRTSAAWERFPVNTEPERRALLHTVRAHLASQR